MSEYKEEYYFDAYLFALWLKEARHNAHLTTTRLAELAGVSKQYVSLLEKGDDPILTNKPVQPALDKVERLAIALNADVSEARKKAGYPPKSVDIKLKGGIDLDGTTEITTTTKIKKPTNVRELFEALEQLGLELHFDGGMDKLEQLGEESLQEILDGIVANASVKVKRAYKDYQN